jgi:lactoylglutathione lyase
MAMKFSFVHNNINVRDLEKSIAFYEEALGLKVVRRKEAEDGSFVIVFMQGGGFPHQLELTWLKGMDRPYELGDNEIHMAFTTDDMRAAKAKHDEMGAVVFENPAMGIYFIADPDGYWTEIIPA